MEPRLDKIEALAEPGCYSLSLTLGSGEERAVVARMRAGVAVLPAGAFDGWPVDSPSFRAVLAAVVGVDTARGLAGPAQARLVELDGGWDVGLGNVVLVDGQPACVSHGRLEQVEPARYRCPSCGAGAGVDLTAAG